MKVEPLAVQKLSEVEEQDGVPWLVEGLWMRQGVGFLCGSPKSCKTWLALDLALSVASKTAVLGEYPVAEAGPALLFVAEDPPAMVRTRIAGMARRRGLSLDELPLHVVLQRSLRLESAQDQARLRDAVAEYRPKLLVLDPFVRLTAIDENSSLEVSAVLAYLRALQTTLDVAILVVHHARKSGSNGASAGLALRGSGDFWAWGDSNLYLSRKQERLQLAVEHRSAPTPEPVTIELCADQHDGPFLQLCDQPQTESNQLPLAQRILDALRSINGPRRLNDLRAELRVRMQSLVDALRQLEHDGEVCRGYAGWDLALRDLGPIPTTRASGETEAGSAEEQPAEG